MKFKHGTRRRALEYEKDWVQRWKADKTFEKSVENRSKDDAYVFYDGPPFITGVPHHGTLLSSIVKDAVPRYWTMKGKRVERVWGWDCHGLPAENFVEKQLNIVDRRQIVTGDADEAPKDKDGNELPTISLEQYITKARESMVANSATWEGVIDRIGRWVDFKGAYKTMDKDFMESVWWAFKELYEKGKIYEGEKVLMYDTKFATPVSKAEVTMDNDAYQTVTDPSVYVKFKLDDGSTLLAWTTTPWTLPGNTALAVNKDLEYVEVKTEDEQFILAKDLVEKVLRDEKHQPLEYEVLREMKGSELVGLSYEPLFQFGDSVTNDGLIATLVDKDFTKDAADFDEDSSWKREAARAVLENDEGKVALMHSEKWDYYKLPGGGIDEGETQKEALRRELLEEVGAEAEILEEIGTLEELRACANNQRQISYAYHAKVVGKIGENALEEGELAEEFVVVWVDLDEAIELTKSGNRDSERGLEMQFMAYRDELILCEYKKQLEARKLQPHNSNAYKVWAADYVSAENGTGIVHLAPIYGEEDFVLAQANNIPRTHVLDDNGYYYPEVALELYKLMPWVDDSKPLEVWENNKNIAKGLEKAGVVWKTEYIRHEYPFNPRSKQRIMYRAIPSWFFDIQGSKPLMLEQNENINWFPEHLKHGRFAKNIEQAPDWNLSRDRFWATAMPVWKGDKGTVKVIGSYAELKELSGVELEDYHRPWVDDITFEIDGEKFTRIDKVLDGWFESGSMPFAQLHYPFENKERFEANYPADFIVEYVGQVRAWFYYVHAVNTSLAEIGAFGKLPDNNTLTSSTDALLWIADILNKNHIFYAIGGGVAVNLYGSGRKINDIDISIHGEDFDKIVPLVSEYIVAGPKKYKNEKWDCNTLSLNYMGQDIDLTDRDTLLMSGKDGSGWIKNKDIYEKYPDCIHEINGVKVTLMDPRVLLEYKLELSGEGQDSDIEFLKRYIHQDDNKILKDTTVLRRQLNAFKNVITTGVLAGNDGRKMSKSLGNFTDPNELMDKFSADSLRFLLLGSPLLNGEDFSLQDKDVGDVARKLSMIWNMYDFFTMYAEVDGWEFDPEKPFTLNPDDVTNSLDKWVVSRLHQLNEEVTRHMDDYNIPDALSPILPFIDDASNWYVRRSRRRFWKSEDDADKNDAYRTLHYVLLKLSVILAPFTPFLAEELYKKLGGGNESVHLVDWPTNYTVDEQALHAMELTRRIVNEGLGARAKAGIKVRQPLGGATVVQAPDFFNDLPIELFRYYEAIITEELNIKELGINYEGMNIDKEPREFEVIISTDITPELKREGLMREVVRLVQNARKNAGLNVDDRIVLDLTTEDGELRQAIEEHKDVIATETLTEQWAANDGYNETAKVDDAELRISLQKH